MLQAIAVSSREVIYAMFACEPYELPEFTLNDVPVIVAKAPFTKTYELRPKTPLVDGAAYELKQIGGRELKFNAPIIRCRPCEEKDD